MYKNVTINNYRIVQPQSYEGNIYTHRTSYDQTFYFGGKYEEEYAASAKFPVKSITFQKHKFLKLTEMIIL